MQPNTPAKDAPIDDELLPPAPFSASLSMPTPTFAESIDGVKQAEVDSLFAPEITDEEVPRPGLLKRLGRAIFGH